jgi:hypothetical protein
MTETPMPKSSEVVIVHDDVVDKESKLTIEERHHAIEQEARTRLATRGLPVGAMIRIDDEPKDAKQPVMTPETASKLLGAISDLSERAGLTRKDAVPSEPLDKDARIDEDDPPPSNPKKGADEDEDGETGIAKLMRMTEGLSKMLLQLSERLDTIEGKKQRKDADKEKEEPEELAADSAVGFEPKSEVLFSDAQARADKVYSSFGGSAAPPMSGESLMAYRRRLLRPLMPHSDTFKDLDIGVASLDRQLFNTVERGVHKEAIAASKNPLVPNGYLQERTVMKSGHQHTTFHGSPLTWMSRFMPAGRAVKKINLRPPTEEARW